MLLGIIETTRKDTKGTDGRNSSDVTTQIVSTMVTALWWIWRKLPLGFDDTPCHTAPRESSLCQDSTGYSALQPIALSLTTELSNTC
jgi:hypothetical protein